MRISYKAVYFLLETFYAQRSLNFFINQDIDIDIFNASILFAKGVEGWDFLAAVHDPAKRADLDSKYVFFTNHKAERPIVLERDKDLTLVELGLLYKNTGIIHIQQFLDVIVAQAGNAGLVESEIKTRFETMVTQFKSATPTVKVEK